MRKFLLLSCAAVLTFGCAPSSDTQAPESTAAAQSTYDIAAQYNKFAQVPMAVDTSFLSAEEREVVNLLMQAARYMDQIYMRQVSPDNPKLRAEIAAADIANKELVLKMFDRHYGPWDTLDGNHAFYGDKKRSPGAGFYPAGLTKAQFDAWIKKNPDDEEAFNSWYTVIRKDGANLVAVPYSEEYKEFLEPAAALLKQASAKTSNASLKKFLSSRADAFLSNDYYQSELDWMDLDGTPIEVVIGPYEVYTDGLLGLKTAFEAFITVKNPEESAALAKYKNYLKDMEANLPVEEKYKNFKRGFKSPIIAAYQVRGGGDNVPGVQTIAFNLPNDERVREAKGAKKVILNNVLGAKFDRILSPMAAKILVPEQAKLLMKKYMANNTLFHELSHSLGPGTIVVDGKETTVSAQLKELSSKLEEGKADVMGAYNILYMMDKGELPIAEKKQFLATYFVGLFRAMRFGTDSAHGGGAAFQYSFLRDAKAVKHDGALNRYQIDFEKMEQAIKDLTSEVVVLQGDGDYAKAKAFLKKNAKVDGHVRQIMTTMGDIPVDIAPSYPDKI